MGYTGKLDLSERTSEVKQREAKNVIRSGFEIIDTIWKVRD